VLLKIEMPRGGNLPNNLAVNAPVFSVLLACARIPAAPAAGLGAFAATKQGNAGVSQESFGNRSGRRRFMGLAAAGCILGLPCGRIGQAAVLGARRLSFYSLHTEELLSTVYWQDGRLVPAARTEIDWHLRDFRTGDVHVIDPDLLDLLHQLGRALAYDGPIHVISGYRSPQTNAMLAAQSGGVAKNSYHVRGMAIDIRLPGRPLREVQQAALELKLGGVGFYPKSDFVHVDTGPVRSW
jgi:uncharacterized protein YcbK (DUF882 family)